MSVCFEGLRFDLLPDETVLEGIERHGAQLPAFCRRGLCQACLVQGAARAGAGRSAARFE